MPSCNTWNSVTVFLTMNFWLYFLTVNVTGYLIFCKVKFTCFEWLALYSCCCFFYTLADESIMLLTIFISSLSKYLQPYKIIQCKVHKKHLQVLSAPAFKSSHAFFSYCHKLTLLRLDHRIDNEKVFILSNSSNPTK